MPRQARGSVFRTRNGYGIRWLENGRRPQRVGFRTKTEARDWFDKNVKPRLRRGGPSPEITFADFANTIYLPRWQTGKAPGTVRTVQHWLVPPLDAFGKFTLRELEGAAEDIAQWRATILTDDKRHKSTRALRQVLAAAVRWGYLARNPALDAGQNPAPRSTEIKPFTPTEIDRIIQELGPRDAAIVVFATQTGLRTNEWIALERRDIDRRGPAVMVQRRCTNGRLVPYPKTEKSRRRVPLTPRALEALDLVPPRLDTPVVFAGVEGRYLDLGNWRYRTWHPALEGAGVEGRGPYAMRHTFATNALAAGVSIYELARLMGASVATIDRHYGHLAHDSEDHLRELLTARSARKETG